MKRIHFLAFLSLVLLCHGQAVAKGLSKRAIAEVEERYQGPEWDDLGVRKERTVLVLQRTEILASKGGQFKILSSSPVLISPRWPQIDIRGEEVMSLPPLARTMTQLEVGTLLGIRQKRFKDDRVELWCETLTKYPVTRESAFKTETNNETVFVKLRFFFDESVLEKDDLETIFRTIDSWVEPFPTEEEAKVFRNSLITVPEIKLGMTIADVESIFGIPLRKATLGEKVIYKYEDMAVEFFGGTVSDVQF